MIKLTKEEILGELQFNWKNPHTKNSKHWERNQRAYKRIAAIIKNQPTITEEWIIESAENVAADYPEVAFPNLIAIFKGLLTEAGVSITVDPHRKSGK